MTAGTRRHTQHREYYESDLNGKDTHSFRVADELVGDSAMM